MMHVTRGELRKESKSDGAAGKRFRGKFLIFTELLQKCTENYSGKKISNAKQSKKSGRLKKKI
jgi:hypothetical protein